MHKQSVKLFARITPALSLCVGCLQTVTPSQVTCPPGSVAAPGGCRPIATTLRLIAPISLGETTLLRPTLRWTLPPGADGAAVDLCRDRACNGIIEQLVVQGTSARPTRDLPPRATVYWRVRPRAGDADMGNQSATWLFHTPTRNASAGVDSSANSHPDLNGDGFDDLAVGAPGEPFGSPTPGRVYVFYGASTGLTAQPGTVLSGPSVSSAFGSLVSNAGDINGDGFGDLLVTTPLADAPGVPGGSVVQIYPGGPNVVQAMPMTTLSGIERGFYFFLKVAAGDFNGDGFGDLVFSRYAQNAQDRQARSTTSILRGSATGLETVPALRVPMVFSGDSATPVASAGDVNGDGFGDFVIGSPSAMSGRLNEAGSISLYLGNVELNATRPSATRFGTTAQANLGSSLSYAGDINGDGYGDLVVGSIGAPQGGPGIGEGRAWIFTGDSTGQYTAPPQSLQPQGMVNFSDGVAGLGDVNGDGYADVGVAAFYIDPSALADSTTVNVFLGTAMGINAQRAANLGAGSCTGSVELFSAMGRDVNGDGFSDVPIGSAGVDSMNMRRANVGAARVYLGGQAGLNGAPVILNGAQQPSEFFGKVMARRNAGQREHSPNRAQRPGTST